MPTGDNFSDTVQAVSGKPGPGVPRPNPLYFKVLGYLTILGHLRVRTNPGARYTRQARVIAGNPGNPGYAQASPNESCENMGMPKHAC